MGLVSGFVGSAQNQLDDVAASAFGDVLSALSTTFTTAATLAVVFLGVNLMLQYRPMSPGAVVVTLIKLVAIITIGLKWSEFDKIASAVQDTINGISGTLLSSYGGGAVSGSGGLPGAIDEFFSKYFTKSNAALENMGWMAGALLSASIAGLAALVGAAAALVMIFAQVVVTALIGVAPVFIGLSMFDTTKDYFYKWLQNLIHYMLYPLVIAVMLGAILRLLQGYMDTLSAGSLSESISDYIPFLACLFIMAISIIFIPIIVSALSGVIAAASPVSAALAAATLGKSALAGAAMKGAVARGAAGAAKGAAGSSLGARSFAPKADTVMRMHQRTQRLMRARSRDEDNL